MMNLHLHQRSRVKDMNVLNSGKSMSHRTELVLSQHDVILFLF